MNKHIFISKLKKKEFLKFTLLPPMSAMPRFTFLFIPPDRLVTISFLKINPFKFIRNNRCVLFSGGSSGLGKNAVICPQRAILPIQSGATSR